MFSLVENYFCNFSRSWWYGKARVLGFRKEDKEVVCMLLFYANYLTKGQHFSNKIVVLF